ncbi:PREDICTED: Fc receptor-like protein 5 isoform X2 [Dipodomys ordii]|uniref:Fc receptor-like protein 5 isoform X2 n=1 Tax=Dipodomys ordii TaxID=10020 RepID=A0A1S3GB59_DIPOR|nr:PREDICTED: Fc receptor-like protein 5 isoform X2 [Dipodomys ordii]
MVPVFMPLWAILLVLGPVPGQSVSRQFRDTVTLSCHKPGFLLYQIKWYHGGKLLSHNTNTFQVNESGNFKCQADNLLPSKSVHLEFSNAQLILQAPFEVFERDSVVLKCQEKKRTSRSNITFYRNGQHLPHQGTEYHIQNAGLQHNGDYRCNNRYASSNKVKIQVQELFPRPVLLARPSQPTDGSPVNLTCDTQLSPQKSNVQLKFCFLKDNLISRQVCSQDPEYHIPAIRKEDSTSYRCKAGTSNIWKTSRPFQIPVQIPVSQPTLTLRTPRTQAVVGDMIELHCEAPRGSPPILYQFYHENIILGRHTAPSGGGASFNLSLTAEHSGNYLCEATNGQEAQRSVTITLNVIVPVSHPGLTLRMPRTQAVVGDTVELHCEVLTGSPPIQYQFYHENVNLGNSSALSGGGASFNLFLTEEHSGNYFCEASNVAGAQQSEAVSIKVIVPVSRPVLTLRAPKAQVVVGDVVELLCEALSGSPPILYQFYYENITLGNSSAPFGGGAFFNFSVTREHSGNYSCEANNRLWAQQSDKVTLFVTGLTGDRSGSVAAGLTGVLLSMVVLAAGALLFHCWLSRKAGRMPASDPTRRPSDSEPQEPTYSNVSGWVELQPVYSNVNSLGGDVVYSEVRRCTKERPYAVASVPLVPENKGSPVIYTEVKVACTSASKPNCQPPQ